MDDQPRQGMTHDASIAPDTPDGVASITFEQQADDLFRGALYVHRWHYGVWGTLAVVFLAFGLVNVVAGGSVFAWYTSFIVGGFIVAGILYPPLRAARRSAAVRAGTKWSVRLADQGFLADGGGVHQQIEWSALRRATLTPWAILILRRHGPESYVPRSAFPTNEACAAFAAEINRRIAAAQATSSSASSD